MMHHFMHYAPEAHTKRALASNKASEKPVDACSVLVFNIFIADVIGAMPANVRSAVGRLNHEHFRMKANVAMWVERATTFRNVIKEEPVDDLG